MKLQSFNTSYQELINGYQLVESQLQFTGHPRECIKLLSTSRAPILAIVEGKLVTYFDLHEHEGVAPYSDNSNAILVRAFSTDVHEQGKGYAKKHCSYSHCMFKIITLILMKSYLLLILQILLHKIFIRNVDLRITGCAAKVLKVN
ncbi:hypothetical protein [Solibacillus sp. FSL K6-1523]|uniref:hypothetical protein n=1 Tax=Solibacillus sp. FSL K6-1523 TaxID=2921471 RepID=UPI004046912C